MGRHEEPRRVHADRLIESLEACATDFNELAERLTLRHPDMECVLKDLKVKARVWEDASGILRVHLLKK